jgi:hypothetical protein
VWPERPKAFSKEEEEERSGTKDVLRSDSMAVECARPRLPALLESLRLHKTGGKYSYLVGETTTTTDSIVVAPKRTSASALADLLGAFGAPKGRVPTHAVSLFHVVDAKPLRFPLFDAPDGGIISLGVVPVLCRDGTQVYTVCDAAAWPLTSPRAIGMSAGRFEAVQIAVARMLRLVPSSE